MYYMYLHSLFLIMEATKQKIENIEMSDKTSY